MANQISSISYDGYTYSVGNTIRVSNNRMYVSVTDATGNNINMLSQCVMKITEIWEGTSVGVPVANPLKIAWISGPNGSYNGGGYIRLEQIVKGSGGTANNFTLRYVANGGTGAMADQVVEYGVNTPVRDCAFTREGHNFRCWWRTRDYDNTGYGYNSAGVLGWYPPDQIVRYDEQLKNGGIVSKTTPSGIAFLHAQWSPWQHTVAYDATGGTGAPGNQTKTYGIDIVISSVIPTKQGNNFLGWAMSPGGEIAYQPGQGYGNNFNGGVVTLYAVWSRQKVTVTFDSNGGSSTENKRSMYRGDPLATLPTATKPFYKFNGWFTKKVGGEQVVEGTIVSTDITLYAQYRVDAGFMMRTDKNAWVPMFVYEYHSGKWCKVFVFERYDGKWKQSTGK